MTLKSAPFTIHKEGWPFIILAALLSVCLGMWVGPISFIFSVILLSWVVYFFRDPARVTPVRPGLVISPADGRVCAIADVEPDEDLGLGDEPRTRVSIFLNVFDVHVNRSAAEGTVSYVNYRPGKFLNASLDKASVDNERNALAITLEGDHGYSGQKMGIVQIAGLIARRIVCTAKPEDKLKTGERFGLIRFGSRTDIYLPKGVIPMVCVGQRMVGGETIIADMKSDEERRVGEVR